MADPPRDNDDARVPWEWGSRWPRRAWVHIAIEASYLSLLLAVCFAGFLLVWLGRPAIWLSLNEARSAALDRYLYYVFGGLLGGSLFGIKWLYRAVARGLWHLDRTLWRILSPLLSSGFALAA